MNGEEIAIIGIACRFPGAKDVHQYWSNLVRGEESIAFLTVAEREQIKDPKLVKNPLYVPCRGGVLADTDHFDAPFFGYAPREAALMDPQIRLFHECVRTALEDAGYLPGLFAGDIGLYAGGADNLHWKNNVLFAGENAMRDNFALAQLIDKDFLCSRIAYNLNLTGPCFALQTACSTSLVAVHQACQALLNGECDLAVAGGVALNYGLENGYVYQQGAILSPDGHCRAFDRDAKGTVPGSGMGVVVLKPLENALKDNDAVYALIKGSAINNDGSRKVGYTSPSVAGQTRVIRDALAAAEAEPETVSYVEAHGTGTPLGDPLEVEALKAAFGSGRPGTCGIGSVKTNIGHLDTAAGIAGLIKTTLALQHRQLPPTLHFSSLNPAIDFNNSPFYVVNRLQDWETPKGVPRRAGVSSFGIGGTNAHVVLEGFAPPAPASRTTRNHLVLFSAKSETALAKTQENLGNYLREGPPAELGDVAYTLAAGRESLPRRRAVVAASAADVARQLEEERPAGPIPGAAADRPVVFLFSGQGSQYVNMALETYRHEPLFRKYLDHGLRAYQQLTGRDLGLLLFPTGGPAVAGEDPAFHQTEYVQPLLYLLEYATAQLLGELGVKPVNTIGHSIGEYVSACLAGVFTFEEGLRIVIRRGELMQSMPPGSMLSVNCPEREVRSLLEPLVSVAACNAPGNCVLAGPVAAITRVAQTLRDRGYAVTPLKTSHAFHSAMMAPVVETFRDFLRTFRLREPKSPFISNLSGGPIAPGTAASPDYWAQHITHTVYFDKGTDYLLAAYPDGIFVEVGPGRALAGHVRRSSRFGARHKVLNVFKHPHDPVSDHAHFLGALGDLWVAGGNLNLSRLYTGPDWRRVHLPTYPFDGHAFNARVSFRSVDDLLQARKGAPEETAPSSLYHLPAWEQVTDPVSAGPLSRYNWLVFVDQSPAADLVAAALADHARRVVFVRQGEGFAEDAAGGFAINPRHREDYVRLLSRLHERGWLPDKVLHLWTLLPDTGEDLSPDRVDMYNNAGFYSLVYLAQGVGALGQTLRLDVAVVTNDSFSVLGDDARYPEKAIMLAAVKIIPVEYNFVTCRYIDVATADLEQGAGQLLKRVIARCIDPGGPAHLALRGRHAWVQKYRPVELPNPSPAASLLKRQGVYLITGGLGGMALFLARHLVEAHQATVVLVSRGTPRPPAASDDEQQVLKGRLVAQLEASGRVHFEQADVSDEARMKAVVDACEARFGPISGVLHTAATIDGYGAIQKRKKPDFEESMKAKVQGTLVLHKLFRNRALDFIVLFSTTGTVTYGIKHGEAGYVASNDFLDAMAFQPFGSPGTVVKTINWCDWAQVGLSIRSINQFFASDDTLRQEVIREFEQGAITPAEGVEAFSRIMANTLPRVILSKSSLQHPGHQDAGGWKKKQELYQKVSRGQGKAMLKTPGNGSYKAPVDDLQKKIIEIWEAYFGYQQIGIHDNLFELGANSLDLAQINEALKSRLQIDLPLVTLFEYPTVDKLVKCIQVRVAQPAATGADRNLEEAKNKMNKMRAISRK